MIICETKTKVRIESGWLLHGLVLKMTVAYCGYWESTHTHIHHPPTPAFVGMVLFYWRAFHGPRSMGQNLYLSYPFSLCFPLPLLPNSRHACLLCLTCHIVPSTCLYYNTSNRKFLPSHFYLSPTWWASWGQGSCNWWYKWKVALQDHMTIVKWRC